MYHFDWIKRHADRTPNKLAIVNNHPGRQFTYREFNQRANRFAGFLKDELSVQRGERVSILARNSSDYFEILFACSKIGAILNTLNWRLAVPELEHIINDCTPRILIYEPEFAGAVQDLRTKSPCHHYIVISERTAKKDWNYQEALQKGSPDNFAITPLGFEETWAILYTSGTTGRAKGAQVTYGNFFYNAVGMGQAIDLTCRDINLAVLPAFHIGGLGLYACPTFHSGGTVVVLREFEAVEMLHLIEKWKVSVLILVPAIYRTLYTHPAVAEAAVIGVPAPKWQEVGKAILVVKENNKLTGQEVIDFCQDKLARYKIPRYVEFVEALPKNDLGKVLKRVLREHSNN